MSNRAATQMNDPPISSMLPRGNAETILFCNPDGIVHQIVGENVEKDSAFRDPHCNASLYSLLPPSWHHTIESLLREQPFSTQLPKEIVSYPGNRERRFQITAVSRDENETILLIRNVSGTLDADGELLQLNRTLLALQTAVMSITASLDLEHILNTFTWELSDFLQVDACVIWQLTEDGKAVSLLAAFPDECCCRGSPPAESFPLSAYPLTNQVVVEGYAQQISLVHSPPQPEHDFLRRKNMQTLLLLPLTYQNRPIGLVEALTTAQRVFYRSGDLPGPIVDK